MGQARIGMGGNARYVVLFLHQSPGSSLPIRCPHCDPARAAGARDPVNHHYDDIRSRIAEPPSWWDEYAVPRYGAFRPQDSADIYATTVALLRIACQNCGCEFDVAVSFDASDQALRRRPPLEDQIRDGSIHYGDPPNVECCPAGPTMNCLDLRVLEFWRYVETFEPGRSAWERVLELEIQLPDGRDDNA